MNLEFSLKVGDKRQSKEKMHPPKIIKSVIFQVTKISCVILTVGMDSLTPNLCPKT